MREAASQVREEPLWVASRGAGVYRSFATKGRWKDCSHQRKTRCLKLGSLCFPLFGNMDALARRNHSCDVYLAIQRRFPLLSPPDFPQGWPWGLAAAWWLLDGRYLIFFFFFFAGIVSFLSSLRAHQLPFGGGCNH